MRSVGARVRSNPSVSNSLKMSIGLHIPDSSPTQSQPPQTRAVLTVISSDGRSVRVRIADELTPNQKAKPASASEYEVFSFVGESAPADLAAWSYQGQGTRNVFDVTFPATVASGAKVWLVARWCNRKGQPGPQSQPVAAMIVGTVAEAG